MISKDKLLALLSRDIADRLGVEANPATDEVAHSQLQLIYLNIVLPLLDALEFDARPVYREMVMNAVRDLIAEPPAPEIDREQALSTMRVGD